MCVARIKSTTCAKKQYLSTSNPNKTQESNEIPLSSAVTRPKMSGIQTPIHDNHEQARPRWMSGSSVVAREWCVIWDFYFTAPSESSSSSSAVAAAAALTSRLDRALLDSPGSVLVGERKMGRHEHVWAWVCARVCPAESVSEWIKERESVCVCVHVCHFIRPQYPPCSVPAL